METGKSKQEFSIRSRAKSFTWAFHGLKMMFKTEHNLWIHTFAAIVAVVVGLIEGISEGEWLAVIIVIGFVFSAEAFNTAIESLTDLVSPEHNPVAGNVKDIAAAGVLIAAVTAIVTGVVVFIF